MFKVDGCYQQFAGDVWALFEMCEFADKGQLPVEGGVLNQTQSFLDALRFVRQEKTRNTPPE